MEAADSDRRAPRKPSMYGDWDDEAHMGSGEDTDNDGNMNGWVGAPYVPPMPQLRFQEQPPQQQPSTPQRRHSKKHDWGNQLCSKPGCDRLLRETPQVRWGPEGPMCNACGCKRSRDKAKANGGHVPHFPKNYRPPHYDPYWGYAPYDPYAAAAYAHHYPHLAPMPHPHHLQGPLGLLPPPGVPLAHFAPYPMAAVVHPLAAAANNSVRVVRRSAARRSTLADTPGDNTPASSSAGGDHGMDHGGAPGSPAVGSPFRHSDQSFPGGAPGSPLVTRGTAAEYDLDLEAAAAAAMSATKQHPQQRRTGPLGGSSPGDRHPGGGDRSERGGEARVARSSSPAGSDSSLWFALLEVVQEESEGPSPRRPGSKRAASEMEVESDQEFTSPRSRPPQRAKLSRFANEVGGQGGYLMADSDIVEEPALQYTASGRPARHAHKQLDDDFVAP